MTMTCLDCGLVTVDPEELDACGLCRACLDGDLMVDAETAALLDIAFAEPDLPFNEDAAIDALYEDLMSRSYAYDDSDGRSGQYWGLY